MLDRQGFRPQRTGKESINHIEAEKTEEKEMARIKDLICVELNSRKDENNRRIYSSKDSDVENIFKSTQILLEKGATESEAIDRAVRWFAEGLYAG
ncbi:MAG: hypothetical protein WA064_01570 [Candidatus Moraniibacteriota bacterium]